MKHLSPKRLNLIILAILLIGAMIGAVSLINFLKKPDTASTNEVTETPQVATIEADLLAIGTKQVIKITQTETAVTFVVNNNNQHVASREYADGFIKPSTMYSVITLDANNPREYIRWDQVAGPHQFETHILTIHKNNIYTIPSSDFENEQFYEPFWNSRDNLVIGDIDNDGFSEIIEFTDEYPPDAPRSTDSELEMITRREFPDDLEADMWAIVSRENYGEGRGRKVIWGIHTFVKSDPPFFRKLSGEEYNNLATRLIGTVKSISDDTNDTVELVAHTELVKDSIDFNVFARNFWSLQRPYTTPFEDNLE